ncbi:hypothetical protein QUG92_13100 [Curtobacterium sp. RHCKG23]|uniref:Uncharacterized protein n=1 Tax=Curtobacterium citri TaxID=3055139 RepID=A0ABT7T8Y8_9MICO|nr:hypothetical protein [Curtobacterium citri]MDM7886043.1 hypothetical protein [Curtobacterium citri]
MDKGRAVVGVSVIGALVLAAGLVVETVPTQGLTTSTTGGGVCGTYPEGSAVAAAWFMTDLQNETDHDVRVRTVRIATIEGVRLEHLALAPHPRTSSPGVIITEDPDQPAEYGRTVPVGSGVVVRPHSDLNVSGRIVLDPDRTAGFVRGVVVTTQDGLGRLHTVTEPIAFGTGIGTGHDASEIGCHGA